MAKKTRRYELLLSEKENTPFYPIAMLFDNESEKMVMMIYYDKFCYQNLGYHCCLHGDPNDPDFLVLAKMYLDDYELDLLENHSSLFLACALHEYGHFQQIGFSQTVDDDERKARRESAAISGEVVDEELLADQFAVKYAGKSAVIAYLDYLIRRRRIRNDEAAELAIIEMERRKRIVKAM